jgi:hypothetical protein
MIDMTTEKDFSAQLPNGQMFAFWEVEQTYERELHVDHQHPNASDQNDGAPGRPFKTINAAAQVATPGTRVLIHGGTYRETVQPARGGLGPEKMISYEAYQGEEVIIKASWRSRTSNRAWVGACFVVSEMRPLTRRRQSLGNRPEPEDFKGYNPFCAVNILHDRLFIEYDKTDMTPYLNAGHGVCGRQADAAGAAVQPDEPERQHVLVEANGQKVHIRLPRRRPQGARHRGEQPRTVLCPQERSCPTSASKG